jgi:hypothetical protein
MKMIFPLSMVLGWGVLSLPVGAQSGPATFPLAGDWQGASRSLESVNHLTLHMNVMHWPAQASAGSTTKDRVTEMTLMSSSWPKDCAALAISAADSALRSNP